MKCDSQEQPEAAHWTVHLPWFLAFLLIVVVGVLKFDQGYAQGSKGLDVKHEETLMDLNTATQAELETLPDIGPVLARRMISARPFVTLEDLKRVPGIGPILIQRLSPKVWVNKAR